MVARIPVEVPDRTHTLVSVCLPARDEAATIGPIVAAVRRDLIERDGLVDEIVVIDDGSSDATARVAASEGALVFSESSILPELPSGSGKGNALWKSLYACRGDVICWLDADIRNFDAEFVTRLVRPLLDDPRVLFTKGYYRRPLHDEPNGGGRVTELVARPLLSHWFPGLQHIIQPLSGEYAGRREILEVLPFVEGWGVELGLLVDIAQRLGTDAITQVDLGVRQHRNRPCELDRRRSHLTPPPASHCPTTSRPLRRRPPTRRNPRRNTRTPTDATIPAYRPFGSSPNFPYPVPSLSLKALVYRRAAGVGDVAP